MRNVLAAWLLAILISTTAAAAPGARGFTRVEPPVASPPHALPGVELGEGTYVSEGSTNYFLGGRFVLAKWADGFLLTARVKYGGYPWDFEVQLKAVSPGVYSGEGQISGRFTSGTICRYPTTLSVQVTEGKAYLRDFSPNNLYNELHPSGVCYGGGEYSWFTHKSAFVRSMP